MNSYEVIAEASRMLMALLRQHLTPEPIGNQEAIGLCSPGEPGNYILGLNIYNIEENQGMGAITSVQLRPGLQQDPPTPLLLYYMLTVYSKAGLASRALDEQRILGRAIQVLNDHGRFNGRDRSTVITHLNLTMEEKAKIWASYNRPYQLSVYYSVGPIYLESAKARDIVPVKEFQVGIKQRGSHR